MRNPTKQTNKHTYKKNPAPVELEWMHREQARNTNWGFRQKTGYQEKLFLGTGVRCLGRKYQH